MVILRLAGSLTSTYQYLFKAKEAINIALSIEKKRNIGHLTSDRGDPSQPGDPSTEEPAEHGLTDDASQPGGP